MSGSELVRNLGCPTQVGIYLRIAHTTISAAWLPHAGGDIPASSTAAHLPQKAAPRRWGYTVYCFRGKKRRWGCPTQVGIYLGGVSEWLGRGRLPHAGGDIPDQLVILTESPKAAPRRWGYTLAQVIKAALKAGCPTQVGIYLYAGTNGRQGKGLPHAGGDIPLSVSLRKSPLMAAPRRWGYTGIGD